MRFVYNVVRSVFIFYIYLLFIYISGSLVIGFKLKQHALAAVFFYRSVRQLFRLLFLSEITRIATGKLIRNTKTRLYIVIYTGVCCLRSMWRLADVIYIFVCSITNQKKKIATAKSTNALCQRKNKRQCICHAAIYKWMQ